MSASPDPLSRRALRRHYRGLRRAMAPRAQRAAARSLARILERRGILRRARRVALYMPEDGEIDPGPIAAWLWDRGATVLLPVVTPVKRAPARLRFAPVAPGDELRANRYGIPEPLTRDHAAWVPDLVLLPLVAFDDRGHRLGMGGGYYDRTFDPGRALPRRPLLVGVAHACQQAPRLPEVDHDVPLDAVATDAAWHPFSARLRTAAHHTGAVR